jgi:hypothetical protein
MLAFINESNEALQERGITLADVQLHLDYLTGQSYEGNMESCVDNHWAKGCRLGVTYIGKDSDKLVSKDFHNGVGKFKTAVLLLLTPGEESAVRCPRKGGRVDGEQVSKLPHLHLQKQLRVLTRNRFRRKGRNETETNMGNIVNVTSFLAVLQR